MGKLFGCSLKKSISKVKGSAATTVHSDASSKDNSAYNVALKEALIQCRKEIKKSRRWNFMPSPKCFEHAAMLSRQAKNYQNEIKICQLYISQVNQCLSKKKFNKKKCETKATYLCESLAKRMENAKNLHNENGVDVNYL